MALLDGIPRHFNDPKEAARYVLKVHYKLKYQNGLRGVHRDLHGTTLAGYMMARALLAPQEVGEIRRAAEVEVCEAAWDHALEVIY